MFAPPADFNPVTTSDDELAAYALPPGPMPRPSRRPMQLQKSDACLRKSGFLANSCTDHYNGTPKLRKAENGAVSSNNWSGSADVNKLTSYNTKKSYYFIISDYVVPMAEQAFNVCDGGWDYSSSWVGIDGFNSGDVLQAGTESDAVLQWRHHCQFYSAWIQWFPFGQTRISLPVTGGDDMFVEVWNTSSTQGYAYLVNENSGRLGVRVESTFWNSAGGR